MAYRPPKLSLTVDLVALTVRGDDLAALVVRRRNPPYKGRWALPGGFVEEAEDLPEAAVRELDEETSISHEVAHVEQLGTYGRPNRDPRARIVTVAYLVLAPDEPAPEAGSDAAEAKWVPVGDLLAGRLAFDHHQILADGIERARAKLEYSPLATAFCPDEFTVAELRRVYEIVWGVELDPRNFHRKVSRTPGFLEPTGWTTTRDGGRPAQLYKRGAIDQLHPPLLRG